MDGAALCKLVNQLAAFLHAPGETIAVSSGTGEAALVAGPKNAWLQQKVRKLLISCLELLDLSDSTTYESVACAVKHVAQLVMLKKLNQSQRSDEEPSGSINRKRKFAADQWQTLAALVGTQRDDVLPLTPSDAVPSKAANPKGKDRASLKDGYYLPNIKVRSSKSVSEDKSKVVTLKCSECEQTMTSTWFWTHPKKETVHVLVPTLGHPACNRKMGRKCPWLPVDGRPHKVDNFDRLDFCPHKLIRSDCHACGGSSLCEHNKRYDKCGFCKGRRQATRMTRIEKGLFSNSLGE
eukprot:Skav216238  [mRNA]  locus=scaffold5243:95683:96741:- [translate_table: standard]